MNAVLLAGLLALAADPAPPAVDLLFPTADAPARLRLEVTVNGQSPAADWSAFLDKLFDHFDRDGDGKLNEAEASRVIALPLPAGVSAKVGTVTKDEFRAFYRGAGFTPIVVISQPPAVRELELDAALAYHLDRNRDGKLSPTELANAPLLLDRLDESEDEVLSHTEVLAGATTKSPSTNAPVRPDAVRAVRFNAANATLLVALDSEGKIELDVPMDERFRVVPNKSGKFQVAVPDGICDVELVTTDPLAGVRETREFLLAQFNAAVGNAPAMTKDDAEQDPLLRGLVGLFDPADRNGDGKLTLAELTALLDLIERGVGCQVVVTIADRGRSLFNHLDANGDGRLDRVELRQAAKVSIDQLPRTAKLSISRGPVSTTFGPIPVAIPLKVAKPPAKPAALKGPSWFLAMDSNQDGHLSQKEFLGPPALFAKLDTNGDGRIDLSESEAQQK